MSRRTSARTPASASGRDKAGPSSASGRDKAGAFRRESLVAVFALAALQAGVCALALRAGFDHVSDDDFARVTIAQAFAHRPRLDPSATSWLPFPFWWTGTIMALFGRSLAVARVAQIVLASLAAATPYLALRSAGASRGASGFGAIAAIATPWALWLAAATVPEAFTASFAAAAAIGLGARPSETTTNRSLFVFALLLFCACLSRYEVWPVAAVLAPVLVVRAVRAESAHTSRRVLVACAVLAAIGPLAWMAWNLHAHASAIHFFHRVSTFKRNIGAGSTNTKTALLLYPNLLLAMRPELVLAATAGLATLRSPEMRARWLVPLVCAAAQIALLACGNVRDGAPAHHPERALLAPAALLAAFAVDAASMAVADLSRRGASGWVASVVACATILGAWLFGVAQSSEIPGNAPFEDRRPQLARGVELRRAGGPHLHIEPCAFEHFALLAAFEMPERANVQPRSGAPVGPECPHVEGR